MCRLLLHPTPPSLAGERFRALSRPPEWAGWEGHWSLPLPADREAKSKSAGAWGGGEAEPSKSAGYEGSRGRRGYGALPEPLPPRFPAGSSDCCGAWRSGLWLPPGAPRGLRGAASPAALVTADAARRRRTVPAVEAAVRTTGTMKDEVALLATVTLLGVLLQGGLASAPAVGGPRTPAVCLLPSRHWGGAGVQAQDKRRCAARLEAGPGVWVPDLTPATPPPPAYFSLQVISARRAFRVSPPITTGPPDFERIYRAQVNCSEYFPVFLATLWVAGIFFHEGAAALCGLAYLFARLRYFQGYARSAQQRLAPLYASAHALWLLVVLAAFGLLAHFLPAALCATLIGQFQKLLQKA
ncbi:leukotriene C4 synthase [Eubalaena glacialis]|uniref:leukotriene C4 synthase n=1 Tax=Eubalaena glacialis TaxID=27606 RepID=UPI002A5A7E97|nr:leukotriene C4 synthase [Eubalaena glacialis]